MNIKVPVANIDGEFLRFIEVNASMPFEMFGFKFAAHRNVNFPLVEGWVVSELSSGAVAERGKTRKEVLEKVKARLEKMGEAAFRKSYKKIIRARKKAGYRP